MRTIARLDEAVFTGNGHEPLITRVTLLETQFETFLGQCKECKALIVKPTDKTESGDGLAKTIIENQTEVKKVETVERWKFNTAVMIAAISLVSTLLLEVVHIVF